MNEQDRELQPGDILMDGNGALIEILTEREGYQGFRYQALTLPTFSAHGNELRQTKWGLGLTVASFQGHWDYTRPPYRYVGHRDHVGAAQ